ncbi:MAG: NTP transferase domain-containing protein [Bacteroidia bacterium]|nr:NTP transferase domain-containing protein [Bacteroidia bacterium]
MDRQPGISDHGALILAGGHSERMQYPKAFLLLKRRCLAEQITDQYLEAGISTVYIVVNHHLVGGGWDEFLSRLSGKARLVVNHEPDLGRSHSLMLGLRQLKDHDFCFLQNVDNPPADLSLLSRMIQSANPDGITVPVYRGKSGHPILLPRKVLNDLRGQPEKELHLREFLRSYPRTEVQSEADHVLCNLNTRDEYFKYLQTVSA